jgi:hypothetical protein
MNYRLTIGITRLEPGWRIVLDQIGVPFETVNAWANLTPERYSAFVVTGDPGEEGMRAIDAYMKAGGAVLDTGGFLRQLDRHLLREKFLRYVIPADDDPYFGSIWLADIEQQLSLHRNASYCGGLVHLERCGSGALASVPLPVNRLITDIECRRREFSADSPRFPNDIVSRISKGDVRRIVAIALRWLHTVREVPWLHLPNVPDGDQGIFCYRIDSDYGTQRQVEELHEAARDAGGRLTWFLHVEAHADWLDLFKRFSDDEIALHCFRHRPYKGYQESHANIAEGTSLLNSAGITPTGYAGPNGFWSRGLARAVDDLGFRYASEFSIDYDDLPFHPWLRDHYATALQVPIHPICIGSFVRAKGSTSQMKSYFRSVIDRAIGRCEAPILYHHPGHEAFDVTADSIAYARSCGLRPFTMGEYAAWWQQRSIVRYEAFFDGTNISIQWRHRDSAVPLLVERGDQTKTLLDNRTEWQLDRINWQPTPTPAPRPSGLAQTRRHFNPLLWRQGLEDFNARIRQ